MFERDKFQLRKKYKLADRIIEYVQSQSHQINIHVGSDGDPFASLVYRYFIKKIKNLSNVKFTIQTNGLLIKKMYDRHTELFKNLTALNISIDGATKETYVKLRKGGSYKKIIENLEFVKKIKNSLSFKYNLHMVVQEENWREMLLMLEVAKKMSVDKIFFNKIENWNTNLDFSKQNFVNNNDFKKLCKVINADRITETWTLF